MTKTIGIVVIILSSFTTYSQTLNAILFVNDKVINEQIANLNVSIQDVSGEIKIPISYHPGELIFGDEIWSKIIDNIENRITITFDYYQYDRRGRQSISNYEIELKPVHFKQPYLMIYIYDFKKRKYKKWYSHLSNDNYIAEIRFPNSGIYMRK